MAWFIDDYDQYQIFITDTVREYYIPKFRIDMNVEEPYLYLRWNDRERGTGGDQRLLKINYLDVVDGYSGYADNPSSANDLMLIIEAMIVSGFSSGGDILIEKGDLLTHDGISDTILPVSANRKILYTDTTSPNYLKWKYPEAGTSTQTTDFTLALADQFSIITIDAVANIDVTIPTNASVAFPIGTLIWLYQKSTGKPHVIAAGGVTLTAPDNLNATRVQYSTMRLQKIGTDTWVCAEDLGDAFDVDALAFFNAVEALGGSFTTNEKGYINDFFIALKATGSLYTKTHFCHLYVGGTITTIKLNIVDPVDADANHRLETTGSPTINANGVTTNGTTQYVNINYNPSVSSSQNDKCYAFYFRSVGTASNFGALNGSFKGEFLSINQGGLYWALSSIYESGSTPATYTGFWLINRTSSTVADCRRNDVSVDTDADTTDTNINLDVYLGARNLSGAANNHSADNFCFDWGGASLTSAEATALYNACVTLQTALGRNV